VSDVQTYLDQRLLSIAEEALKAAKVGVNKIMSAHAGQLGNSRVWFLYDEAIQREFENALNKAAGLVSQIAGSAAPQHAGHLDKLASELVDQIIEWREQGRKAASAFRQEDLVVAHIARLREALGKARANIVGDFRFGIVEGKQMASNPVQNVVTIQNVRDSIINVVQTGHLSGKYEDVARQLADILKSAEVEQLPTEAKDEVAALADIVKDELSKAPSPDQGKVLRGIKLLGNALGRLGANTAAATIAKLIADYFTSG
jgi:transcription antitermination factor NusA-like protein